VIELIRNLPGEALSGLVVAVVVLVLFVPLALRLAGLSGQQIEDLLTLTLQFFVNLVREFRAQNQSPPKP
jgi:hypothetical protein